MHLGKEFAKAVDDELEKLKKENEHLKKQNVLLMTSFGKIDETLNTIIDNFGKQIVKITADILKPFGDEYKKNNEKFKESQ